MTDDYVGELRTSRDWDPARSCLVLVDLQYATASRQSGLGRRLAVENRLHEAEYRFHRIERYVVPNSLRLLESYRARGLPRVFVTVGSEVSDYSDLPPHVKAICESTNNRTGEREHDVLDELKPLPNERAFNKITLSAFASTPLELVLRLNNVESLVFTGLTTNVCVEHTVRDAADLGFNCILVEDACATDSRAMHEAALALVRRLYGDVVSTDRVLERVEAELTKAAPGQA